MDQKEEYNLSGRWIFSEDFGIGNDLGVMELIEKSGVLEGELEFTETIEDEAPFSIRLKVSGKRNGRGVKFEAISVLWLHAEEPMSYNLDCWEGIINPQGIIVGSSIDTENVCGVFTLRRDE